MVQPGQTHQLTFSVLRIRQQCQASGLQLVGGILTDSDFLLCSSCDPIDVYCSVSGGSAASAGLAAATWTRGGASTCSLHRPQSESPTTLWRRRRLRDLAPSMRRRCAKRPIGALLHGRARRPARAVLGRCAPRPAGRPAGRPSYSEYGQR